MSVQDFTEAGQDLGGLIAGLLSQTWDELNEMEDPPTPEKFCNMIVGAVGQVSKELNNSNALRRLRDDFHGPTQHTSECSATPDKEPEPHVEEVLAIANSPYGSEGRSSPTTNTAGLGQPTRTYEIDSSPRGIVVIFNYHFKGQSSNQRDGAAEDFLNLEKVFTEMGYEVWPEYDDLTKSDTFEKLDEIISSEALGRVDSFIAFFLSHGGGSPDAFKTADGKIITVEEIIYTKFTDIKCPLLRRKPKLFFFNYCRGEVEQMQYDNWKPDLKYGEAPKHVAVVQATLPHFQAARSSQYGTAFVDCLCEILRDWADTLDLHGIVQNTSDLMQKRRGTTATPWFIDFGKFYFKAINGSNYS